MNKSLLATAVIALALVVCVSAQDSRPRFEVASIKPNNGASGDMSCCGGLGRFAATNLTLGMLIGIAYNVQDFRILGAPAWVNSDRFDIEAKADEAARNKGKEIVLEPLLRSLLEDRFKLVVRRETKELPIYQLTVAKGGSKLRAGACTTRDPNSPPSDEGPSDCGFSRLNGSTIRATQIDIEHFIPIIRLYVERTIIDKTGFMGTFDVDLKWNPNEFAQTGPTDTAPSIFTALSEQLGLKLESARGPVEVLVIDSVSRPTEN